MIIQSLQKVLAGGLGAWFLLISVSMASPITSHTIDHHHSQHSHSQTWCDWMCKASHAIHTPSVSPAQSYDALTLAFQFSPTPAPSILLFSPGSRAPPGFTLSSGVFQHYTQSEHSPFKTD